MKKELKVQDWKEEIEAGLKYRREYGLEKSWATLEAMFFCLKGSNADKGPNLIASNGDAMLASVSVPNPVYTLKAKRLELLRSSRVLESVDNLLVQEMELKNEMETAALHTFLWGRGIIKIGYDSEFGYSKEHDALPGMTVSMFDKKGQRIEYKQGRSGMPWAKAVPPHDIVVPWGTGENIGEAPWIAHRIVRHIEDIKADVKYTNKKNLQPNMGMEDFVASYTTVQKPYRLGLEVYNNKSLENGGDYVELWEIRDKRTGKIYVIATGHDKYLRNENDILQLDGLPFVSFSFTKPSRAFWTTPDAYYLLYPQAELTDISLQASKQRRLNCLKFLFRSEAIEQSDLDNLLSSKVGAGLPVKPGFTLRDIILPIGGGANNSAIYQDADYTRRYSRETIGLSRNRLGEYESGRRTATEASYVNEGSGSRMSRRFVALAKAYELVIRKCNQEIFKFWTMPRQIEIAGEEFFVPFTGRDLKGEYHYKVTFSGGEDALKRKQEALMIYASLREDPQIDQRKLRNYLMNSFNDRELEGLFMREDPNASIRMGLSSMQQGSGNVQPQGQLPQTPPMQTMQS